MDDYSGQGILSIKEFPVESGYYLAMEWFQSKPLYSYTGLLIIEGTSPYLLHSYFDFEDKVVKKVIHNVYNSHVDDTSKDKQVACIRKIGSRLNIEI